MGKFFGYFYIGGIFSQFIYLNFFHSVLKHANISFNIGRSLIWLFSVDLTPWWVWLFAIIIGILNTAHKNK